MKKMLGVVAGIGGFIVLLVAMGLGKSVGEAALGGVTESRKKQTIEQALIVTAEQVRSSLPLQLDPQTTLVDVSARGTEIVYLHRISGMDAREVTDEHLSGFAESLNTRTCDMAQTRVLLDAGGTMTYAYRDDEERVIGRISLDKASCIGGKPRVERHAVQHTDPIASGESSDRRASQAARDRLAPEMDRARKCLEMREEQTKQIGEDLSDTQAYEAYEAINARYLTCMKG